MIAAALHPAARGRATRLRLASSALLSLAPLLAFSFAPAASARPREMPPLPAERETAREQQVAVLAGGCFWGIEAVFEHVRGVRSVHAGYAGGTAKDAHYRAVSSQRTDHAEAVRIAYDPSEVRYAKLLEIVFAVAHDPTQLNRQTPDVGRSYRSAIFPQNAQQRQIALDYISALDMARTFGKPVVTSVEDGVFYPAEAYHQDFLRKNPHNAYIVRWDMPKLTELKKAYPALYRD